MLASVIAAPGQLCEYILINADGDVIDRARVHTNEITFPAAYVQGMWQNELDNGAVIFIRVYPKLK